MIKTIIHFYSYEFKLHSDDGSILWLNNEKIVDNDGGHQMRSNSKSIILDKGNYNAKLWYFQGMPDRFGFIFDAKYIGPTEFCKGSESYSIIKMNNRLILNDLNFENAQYILNSEGIKELRLIAEIIRKKRPSSIQIIGHTDNVGNSKYNELLALERAKFVCSELKKIINSKQIKFSFLGKGNTEPIKSNKSNEGRAANRRVEIILKN